MLLTADSLSFRYPCGKRQILDGFSLSLASGDRLGLSAPSGFGKTTFCKLLAGYEQPGQGRVLLDGKPLSSYGVPCPVQMIWQHPEQVLNPRLKMKRILGEAGPTEPGLLTALGIRREWLERFPGELSGGEQQRFCIVRALGPPTHFLLADELSAMLDLITQAQLWHFLLAETERRSLGLLVVSHDQALLEQVCTRVIPLPALTPLP